MADVPARIWIDLDQKSMGYTDKAHEVTPHDVAFVPAAVFEALQAENARLRGEIEQLKMDHAEAFEAGWDAAKEETHD